MNALLSLPARLCPWSAVDVLNHLWQSTVVALAIVLVVLLCRGLSARTRWVLGWIALAKFALPAGLLVHAFHWTGWGPAHWLGTDAAGTPLTLPAFVVSATRESAPMGVSVTTMLGAIWLVGFVPIWGAWLIRSVTVRRRVLAQARPIDSTLAPWLPAAMKRASFKRAPRCVQVPAEHGPGLLGIMSPSVILPRELEKTLTPAELESVLLHELVHLRRGDNAWAAASALFCAVFWFHPLVWILARQLALETEQSCDERVVEITGDPDTYAQSIVKSVQHAFGLSQPCFAGATTPPVILRIKNILAHRNRPKRRVARVTALCSGVLLVALSGRAGSFGAAEESVAPVAISNANLPDSTNAQPAAMAPAAAAQQPASIASTPDAPLPPQPAIAPAPHIAPDIAEETPAMATAPASAEVPAATTPNASAPVAPPALASEVVIPAPAAPAAAVEAPPPMPLPSALASAGRVELAETEAPASATHLQIYDVSALDRMPVPRSQQPPRYPLAMRRMGIMGKVTVDFLVDTNGDVQNAYVVGSTRGDFESSAIEAVRHWKFKPGQRGGKNVNSHMQVPIVFRLNDQ